MTDQERLDEIDRLEAKGGWQARPIGENEHENGDR